MTDTYMVVDSLRCTSSCAALIFKAARFNSRMWHSGYQLKLERYGTMYLDVFIKACAR